MNNFNVGDLVIRKESKCIPENPGCYGMSINTAYKIEYITPKGLLVLENYLMLVNPEHVILKPKPLLGYYLQSCADHYIMSEVFLFKEEVENYKNNRLSNTPCYISQIEINLNSLLEYIKNNNLV